MNISDSTILWYQIKVPRFSVFMFKGVLTTPYTTEVWHVLIILLFFQIQGPTCQPGDFLCDNGRCLTKHLVCDKFIDCSDGADEDETMCATCPYKFLCTNGRCKDLEDVCDGTNNCQDNSDEDHICVGENYNNTGL